MLLVNYVEKTVCKSVIVQENCKFDVQQLYSAKKLWSAFKVFTRQSTPFAEPIPSHCTHGIRETNGYNSSNNIQGQKYSIQLGSVFKQIFKHICVFFP
jgi:hypothetical protein